jgi:hypothetical protein
MFKFIPAQRTAVLESLAPKARKPGTPPGLNLTALPAVLMQKKHVGVPITQTDAFQRRVDQVAPVLSRIQPTASDIGARWTAAPSAKVQSVSTSIPKLAAGPVGCCGFGLTPSQFKIPDGITVTRVDPLVKEETPWAMYAAYGAAGAAALGLGYVLLSKKRSR